MSIRHITQKELEELMQRTQEPILVDFYADWCGPCKMLAPVLEGVAAEYPQAVIVKVNVDEESALASRFQVMSIPTLIVLRGGAETERRLGVCGKAEILEMLGL